MLQTPSIVKVTPQAAAVLHLTVPRAEIRHVMGPGLAEVRAALEAQGITPAGPWFTHHLELSSKVFDFEIGVPIDGEVEATGRVRPGGLPAAFAAHAVYQGPYEGLGDAWGALMAWMEAEGHAAAADLWEVYAVGPESSEDPADWRTELYRPLQA